MSWHRVEKCVADPCFYILERRETIFGAGLNRPRPIAEGAHFPADQVAEFAQCQGLGFGQAMARQVPGPRPVALPGRLQDHPDGLPGQAPALMAHRSAALGVPAEAKLGAAATTRFVEALLREVLGFGDIGRVGTRTLGERVYPVTLEALGGRVPVVIVPPSDDLDAPSVHLPSEGRRRSAASAVQDWLNASEGALWGLCSNGVQLRLVRDNASLTRPAFIQADLRRIFEGEAFADFAGLWLLIHASRFGTAGAAPTDCAVEQWRVAGAREGIAARERLREEVEAALLSLGGGFVGHPDNAALRERLASGELSLPEYFGQLLRLVYRLIFLLAAEDRNLLHPPQRRLPRASSTLTVIPQAGCATMPSGARPGTGTTTAGRGC